MFCPSCGHDNIEGTDRCENCMKPLRDLDVPRAEASAGLARSVMEDSLERLEPEAALTAHPAEPAIEVVRRMQQTGAACALIVDDGRLEGIFTEHDVLSKLAGKPPETAHVPVSALMTPRPEVLRESDSVAAALSKMSIGRYRRVPVLKSDGNHTVVSIEHVLKYIAQKDW